MSKPSNKKLRRLINVPPFEMTEEEQQYLALPRGPKKRAAKKARRGKKR